MYNDINNGAGDCMINEKDTGALINQIREVTRDHIDWIKTQLLKPNNFMVAKGREVWIDVPNSKLKNIVTIPSKNDPKYRESWVRVYNLAVDYLEGSLSYACMKGDIDYRTIKWPDFDPANADYARRLEVILDEYRLKEIQKKNEEEEKKHLKVIKSSVMLDSVNAKEVEQAYKKEVEQTIEKYGEEPQVAEVRQLEPEHMENFNDVNLDDTLDEDKPLCTNEEDEKQKANDAVPVSEFVAQKILDGDKITKKDCSDLHDHQTNLVIIPCQDVDNIKEEKLFLDNMHVCEDENIKTGVMVYGHATEEKEAAYELKKIFKLLDQCGNGFTKSIIYEVNDQFVNKNKDSEMKLLSFINAYTMVVEGLSKEGFVPFLSMNLTSKKILSDIYNRYNLDSKYEIVYMVLVRELEDLDKNDSTILMDPQYDYDVLTLRNPKFNNAETFKNIVNDSNIKSTTLAKAA